MSDFSQERTTATALPPNGNLEKLQELLLAPERDRLDRLEDRLKKSVVDASAVANVLPDAIRQRTKQDQHLEKSMAPIIGKIFVRAIKGSPQLIADAISPVMMPAIRKAIETAVQGMVQSMNRTLDHSGLSRRGLTWRWEAWKTGRSFGEVVLAHTVRYEVERVFLFFREDGTHLDDVRGLGVPPFEPGHENLVSSMFSAIKTAVQKFAQDEFQASEHASMNEFKMDDGKTVVIEHGPKAVLAAVVRGLPAPSLRGMLQEALDSIHVEFNEALQNFRGDKKAFEAARPHLESCLLHEEKSNSKNETGLAGRHLSPALVVMLVLLLSALGWWVVTSYLDQQREADEQLRWAHFLETARGKPGIQITHTQPADGKNGKTIVYGLRDPISDDPHKIAQEVGLLPDAINFQLEPYLSLAPELVKRRDRVRLDQLVREIQTHKFDFEAGGASIAAEPGPALQALLQALRESDVLAQQLGNRIQVAIHGHTSEEGSDETNRRLALARAQGVLSTLNVERFQAIDFLAVAEPVAPPVIGETQDPKLQRARRVSFHVMVSDSAAMGPRP